MIKNEINRDYWNSVINCDLLHSPNKHVYLQTPVFRLPKHPNCIKCINIYFVLWIWQPTIPSADWQKHRTFFMQRSPKKWLIQVLQTWIFTRYKVIYTIIQSPIILRRRKQQQDSGDNMVAVFRITVQHLRSTGNSFEHRASLT